MAATILLWSQEAWASFFVSVHTGIPGFTGVAPFSVPFSSVEDGGKCRAGPGIPGLLPAPAGGAEADSPEGTWCRQRQIQGEHVS